MLTDDFSKVRRADSLSMISRTAFSKRGSQLRPKDAALSACFHASRRDSHALRQDRRAVAGDSPSTGRTTTSEQYGSVYRNQPLTGIAMG